MEECYESISTTCNADLTNLLGKERIITDLNLLREHDSDDGAFAKAFGIYRVPLPICIANVLSKEEVSEVLSTVIKMELQLYLAQEHLHMKAFKQHQKTLFCWMHQG